ncbi:LEM domain-containing protein 2-like [Erpetoichthys calabaricus]|uniref:LEM domain-containing protein 2-like n=1 Tax=Erpetoichthys calabaricus TaxID=27687 RepID=UPI0022345CE4|nr:LEM domain-containing protein 2-like [Erpetoichthys calabaricus]
MPMRRALLVTLITLPFESPIMAYLSDEELRRQLKFVWILPRSNLRYSSIQVENIKSDFKVIFCFLLVQLLAVDCKGKKDSFCAAEENRLQMQLLSKLYNFLAEVAGDLLCGNPSKLKNKCVCLDDIKTYFSVFYPEYLDRMDDSLLTVLQSRKDFGIRLVGEDVNAPVTAVEEIHCLESTHPYMSLWCRLQRAVVIVVRRRGERIHPL